MIQVCVPPGVGPGEAFQVLGSPRRPRTAAAFQGDGVELAAMGAEPIHREVERPVGALGLGSRRRARKSSGRHWVARRAEVIGSALSGVSQVIGSAVSVAGVGEAKDDEAGGAARDPRRLVEVAMPPWWRLDTVRFAAEVAVAAVSERDEAAGLHGGDVVVEVDGAEVGSDAKSGRSSFQGASCVRPCREARPGRCVRFLGRRRVFGKRCISARPGLTLHARRRHLKKTALWPLKKMSMAAPAGDARGAHGTERWRFCYDAGDGTNLGFDCGDALSFKSQVYIC